MFHYPVLKFGKVCMVKVSVMLTIMAFIAGLSFADSISADSTDPTFGPFKFVNNTGGVVYDLETVWTFTGGSLTNGMVTINDGPGATTITASSIW